MRGGSITFVYEWEPPAVGGDAVLLDVSAKIGDYDPGCMYMRNGDPGYPPEGGEVEDMEVTFPDGTVLSPIPDELYQALCDKASDEFMDHGGQQ